MRDLLYRTDNLRLYDNGSLQIDAGDDWVEAGHVEHFIPCYEIVSQYTMISSLWLDWVGSFVTV